MQRLRIASSAIALIAAAGSATADDQVVWKTQGVTKTEIVLGNHTDLSSFVAVAGIASTNAFRLRLDEVNAAGGIHGRKVRFIVEDAQYQVPKAVQAGNKLINHDKIFAMVGALGVAQNSAVFVTQLKAGVPNLFPNTVARQMYEPFHPLKFSMFAPYFDQVGAGVKYLVKTKGRKAVCVMYQDTDFGREILDGVKAELDKLSLKLVASTTHKFTDQDFTANLIRLRGAGCDLIVMASITRDTILAYSTARRMGWNVDMMGTSASYDAAVAAAPGGATEGFYTIGHIKPVYRDTATGDAAKWMDRYKAKFGVEPTVSAALGHIIMDVTVLALEKAGPNLTTKSLVAAIESIKGYQDIFGGAPLSFGPKQHLGSHQALLMQVKNGRWAFVAGPIEP
ncbi:MAG: ABC transporter substrate-binding protein [Rhodospirillaceae bacterium]|nr:ABC transporter substrate-binding protein [Rhodospirillaceae bacterium]